MGKLRRSCHPRVDNDGEDGQAQHVAAQHIVEGQIEEVERERLAKNRVVPGGARRQALAAGISDHGPVVDSRAGNQPGQPQQRQRGDAGVQLVLAQAGAGEFQRAGMRYPQNGEAQHSGGCHRRHAIREQGEPGLQLSEFSPPGNFDGIGSQCSGGQRQHS
jgi:hypothetical protein